MNFSLRCILFCVTCASIGSAAHAADNPYSGQEKRAIKALSESEIADYLNGRGIGTSKAAELNHYPGPKHVLDEAAGLALSAEQIGRTRALYDAMTRDAQRLGQEIVKKEAELEALYARRQATPDNTRAVVAAISGLQGEFRLAHLNAHLGMRDILSAHQLVLYDRLRGYSDDKSHSDAHQHH